MGFLDLFIGSVHTNANLTGTQKLQYLKKIISGEAASMIDQFDCTDNNYTKTWKLLEEGNFINHPSMKDADAKVLRKVMDNSWKTVAQLTNPDPDLLQPLSTHRLIITRLSVIAQ